ncbi:MAG: isopeptide-forming domain-containing fimbrial protein [Pyrinomonadaceae bacterium]
MRCPVFVSAVARRLPSCTVAIFLILGAGLSVFSQGGSSSLVSIPNGSLIIAMDNERQGNAGDCVGPAFNVRAYGLAVRLLHQNIPLQWAIDTTKLSNATYDINNVDVVQLNTGTYGGQTCQHTGGVDIDFRGGPLIVSAAFAAQAKTIITTFNNASAGTDLDVRVYEATEGFTAPVWQTLNHKPFVAVGPECTQSGQCLSGTVYERLFTAAGLQNGIHYAPVANDTFSTYCVTLAAQAHAQADAAANLAAYRTHVNNGGNLLLQCLSVELYEDGSSPRYFTSGGITDDVYANAPPSSYPTNELPGIPFSQFIGNLGRANGYTDYAIDGGIGNLLAGTQVASRFAVGNNDLIAFTRDNLAGTGGQVFALGGHEYGGYPGDGVAAAGGPEVYNGNNENDRVNGSRMALNALLVPANPACALLPPTIQGYKTVRLGNDLGDDLNGNGQINIGDKIEWTVRYMNTSATAVANFQITDVIDNRLTYVLGSIQASATAGSQATANTSFRGNSNPPYPAVADINLLATAQPRSLAAGGMITVKFKTIVGAIAAEIPNQASAFGTGVGTPVATDSADSTTPGLTAGFPIAGDCANLPNICIDQSFWVAPDTGPNDNWTAAIEPTYVLLDTITTAAGAEVSGIAMMSNGRGLARQQVVLQNASTGEVRVALTNSFGRFAFQDVPVGDFFIVNVESRRYTFQVPSFSFSLADNVTDLVFIANDAGSPPNNVKPAESIPVKSPPQDDAVAAPPAKVSAVKAPSRRVIIERKKKTTKKDGSDDDEF